MTHKILLEISQLSTKQYENINIDHFWTVHSTNVVF